MVDCTCLRTLSSSVHDYDCLCIHEAQVSACYAPFSVAYNSNSISFDGGQSRKHYLDWYE